MSLSTVRFVFAVSLVAAGVLASPAEAQAPAASPLAAGTTTRVLAIGHMAAGTTPAKVMPVMPKEVRDTVRL